MKETLSRTCIFLSLWLLEFEWSEGPWLVNENFHVTLVVTSLSLMYVFCYSRYSSTNIASNYTTSSSTFIHHFSHFPSLHCPSQLPISPTMYNLFHFHNSIKIQLNSFWAQVENWTIYIYHLFSLQQWKIWMRIIAVLHRKLRIFDKEDV